MCSQGLKAISYGFIDLPMEEYQNLLRKGCIPDENGNKILNYVESPEFREAIENDLIYLATFGMKDPLRENMMDSIHLIRYGYHFDKDKPQPDKDQVSIRMMTGDHIETARETAVQAGIISPDEAHEDGVVISSETFRKNIGKYNRIWDPEYNEFKIEFLEKEGRRAFDKVKKKCKVIARCTSEDKFVMISGIK